MILDIFCVRGDVTALLESGWDIVDIETFEDSSMRTQLRKSIPIRQASNSPMRVYQDCASLTPRLQSFYQYPGAECSLFNNFVAGVEVAYPDQVARTVTMLHAVIGLLETHTILFPNKISGEDVYMTCLAFSGKETVAHYLQLHANMIETHLTNQPQQPDGAKLLLVDVNNNILLTSRQEIAADFNLILTDTLNSIPRSSN